MPLLLGEVLLLLSLATPSMLLLHDGGDDRLRVLLLLPRATGEEPLLFRLWFSVDNGGRWFSFIVD